MDETHRERAVRRIEAAERALREGRVDEETWHRQIAAALSEAYLATDDPYAQSGYAGTPEEWRAARYLAAAPLVRAGAFLDIGCANGLLMESVRAWAAERGVDIEPYGLEISEDLAALARRRLPQWASRIYLGNARFWVPPRRFDYVRTGTEYAPPGRRAELLRHIMQEAVAPGGRLIVGPQRHAECAAVSEAINAAGLGPATEQADGIRRVYWIEKG